MPRAAPDEPDTPRPLDTRSPFIELRIPPDPAYVRIARLAVGDLATRVGFSIDELDDVRLAVDEVCGILIVTGGSVLVLRMQAQDHALAIEARMPDTRSEAAPSELSALLLGALVDSYSTTNDGADVCFELYKRAREVV